MASLGGFGSLAFELGGRPSAEERIYRSLRGMLGEGGASVDDLEVTTVEGAWAAAVAEGLAAIESVEETAHWQGLPGTASDELGSYEEVLDLVAGVAESDEERRRKIVPRWVAKAAADYPTMTENLDRIDAAFSLLAPDHASAATTVPGKVLDELTVAQGSGTFSFAGRICSLWPLFSDDLVVNALLDLGEGVLPTQASDVLLTTAADYLDRALPAHCDFTVATDVGFTLGSSRLDLTSIGP